MPWHCGQRWPRPWPVLAAHGASEGSEIRAGVSGLAISTTRTHRSIAAADVGRGEEWFDALAAWVRDHTQAGGVVVPVQN